MSPPSQQRVSFLSPFPSAADTQSRGRNLKSFMRACLETQKLEQLEARMDEIADRVARDKTNAARGRIGTREAKRSSY